jgi:hypothetical protein
MSVHTISDREISFIKNLRTLLISEMKRIGDEEVGKKLDLRQGGVECLHWKQSWSTETVIRGAILLDIPEFKQLEYIVRSKGLVD